MPHPSRKEHKNNMPAARHSGPVGNYKVVLLGEGRVGKTSILFRYVDDSFLEGRPSTVQASFLEKRVTIDDDDDGPGYYGGGGGGATGSGGSQREALLSIWDTAGQERYHSLGPIYYRDACGAVLVYDVTDRPSFDRVRTWTKELRRMVGDERRICLVVVGNKCDLERQRAVDIEEGERCAVGAGGTYLECSAKTGKGVEEVFLHLVKKMMSTGSSSSLRNRSRTGLASASSQMASSTLVAVGGNPKRGGGDGKISLTTRDPKRWGEDEPGGCC